MRDAPSSITQVWDRFANVPCETFTKGWWFRTCCGEPTQRTVAQMREHRVAYGAGGNCFDLALWLLHDLREHGLVAWIISRDLLQYDAHVAVLVKAEGAEFLCDLGDLWLRPVHATGDPVWLDGHVAGRSIRVRSTDEQLEIDCRNTAGEIYVEHYDRTLVDDELFLRACHQSQRLLRRPFCQILRPRPVTGGRQLWGYDREATYVIGEDGRFHHEPSCKTRAEYIARIAVVTGLTLPLIEEGFAAYDEGAVPPPSSR
jgi:hypothetical protein